MKTAVKASVVAIVLSLCLVAPAQSKDCVVATALVCDTGICKTMPNSILIKVDARKKSVSRCDEKGCDEFRVEIFQSGEMSNLSNGPQGYLLKLSDVDQSFVEVATLTTVVFLKFGRCLAD
jgi:hypothetical protein